MADNERKGQVSIHNDEEKKKEKQRPDMYRYEKESGVQYAKPGQYEPKRFKNYWRKLMDSTQKKMSNGAAQIARMFSWARGDSWRRGGHGNREHRKPGKK